MLGDVCVTVCLHNDAVTFHSHTPLTTMDQMSLSLRPIPLLCHCHLFTQKLNHTATHTASRHTLSRSHSDREFPVSLCVDTKTKSARVSRTLRTLCQCRHCVTQIHSSRPCDCGRVSVDTMKQLKVTVTGCHTVLQYSRTLRHNDGGCMCL